MIDLLLALLATALLTAAGLLVLAASTVVPFVLALRLADAHGLSTGRVGGMAVGGVLLGMAVAGVVLLTSGPRLLLLLAPAAAYAVPLLLRVLPQPAIAGAAGAHEQAPTRLPARSP